MDNYPQPHENVTGIDRTDSLLSLEDEHVPVRDLLRGLSKHLGSATLVGNPSPVVARMNERMRNPVPGDLVVELSTMFKTGTDDRAIKGLGILLTHRQEWWHTDEEWAQVLADDGWDPELRPVDHAWYIQYGSAAVDICRWSNCSFVTLPWPDTKFAVPAGRREGSAMVFTRESLLGPLSDSGFELNIPKEI